ncbi:hypothetical protein [Streptomyces sp. NPDC094149]|uniref:hypothetical protein n=1 Tax=Streptomyces sp. NPDC094149 TaxID=3155079 RepID=UPI00332E6AC8
MRIAVVGMDGTGKTTVLRRIHEESDIAVIHTMRAHENPASPFAELSRALSDASAAADALGQVHLKVAMLSLHLSLYGRAERLAMRQGRSVLADRHPLIDPLVYLPLFAQVDAPAPSDADVDAWWGMQKPGAAQAVRGWLRTRSGTEDPRSLGAELLPWGTKSPPELLGLLSRQFDVTLPDGVLLFDLPVHEALRRTQGRPRDSELHETLSFLRATRRQYDAVLDWLSEAHPATAVRRIDCSDRSVDQVTELVRDATATWSHREVRRKARRDTS